MRLRPVAVALLSLGVVLLLVLFWQFLDVYFVLGGESADPSAAQGTRYVWTASACVVAMLGGTIAGTLATSKVLGALGGIGVVLAVIAGAVFVVPSDRWVRDDPVHQLPDDYEPCYSGSNDCGPGG
ncbi:hypothetical protein [Aeromicrobium sp. P5_D10]